MCKTYAYMRISTSEERNKQSFNRQEKAIKRYCKENNIDMKWSERRVYRDDVSGATFDREQWQELMEDIQEGDTIIFKDISRFTRDCDNGFQKYMELMEKGINLVFIDNPVISTEYIKNMMDIAENQSNRIAKKSLRDTIDLLILVELDRVEREREITVKRINDGIAASNKKSGRKFGQLDKMNDELREDIKKFLSDRSIKQVDLMRKHNISRNTLKKYVSIVKEQQA